MALGQMEWTKLAMVEWQYNDKPRSCQVRSQHHDTTPRSIKVYDSYLWLGDLKISDGRDMNKLRSIDILQHNHKPTVYIWHCTVLLS